MFLQLKNKYKKTQNVQHIMSRTVDKIFVSIYTVWRPIHRLGHRSRVVKANTLAWGDRLVVVVYCSVDRPRPVYWLWLPGSCGLGLTMLTWQESWFGRRFKNHWLRITNRPHYYDQWCYSITESVKRQLLKYVVGYEIAHTKYIFNLDFYLMKFANKMKLTRLVNCLSPLPLLITQQAALYITTRGTTFADLMRQIIGKLTGKLTSPLPWLRLPRGGPQPQASVCFDYPALPPVAPASFSSH